ncbi:hypothetical protein OAY84_00960 [Candidatus Thioglobus sp.]|nr:hypothetical protein [Candidatus Thioglobus sp.]
MSESYLTISLNEVLFYFTRAAFGVEAPIGLSEDFARANMWISENGFDPSLCSLKALDNLDSQASSLSIKFEKTKAGGHLFCPEEKLLSSLEASSSSVDWVEINSRVSELKISNVDSPFLVVSALGANNCNGLKIVWTDQDKNQFQVNLTDNEEWEVLSASSNPIELSSNADVLISPLEMSDKSYKGKSVKKFKLAEEKFRVLHNGVKVEENWQAIYSYFSRCLVKSSAESRASGAGAGLVDTD